MKVFKMYFNNYCNLLKHFFVAIMNPKNVLEYVYFYVRFNIFSIMGVTFFDYKKVNAELTLKFNTKTYDKCSEYYG